MCPPVRRRWPAQDLGDRCPAPVRFPGQSLVEMAVVTLLLMVLVAGVVDLGRGVYSRTALSNAVREAARYGSTNPTDSPGIVAAAQQRAPGLHLAGTTDGFVKAGGSIRCTDRNYAWMPPVQHMAPLLGLGLGVVAPLAQAERMDAAGEDCLSNYYFTINGIRAAPPTSLGGVQAKDRVHATFIVASTCTIASARLTSYIVNDDGSRTIFSRDQGGPYSRNSRGDLEVAVPNANFYIEFVVTGGAAASPSPTATMMSTSTPTATATTLPTPTVTSTPNYSQTATAGTHQTATSVVQTATTAAMQTATAGANQTATVAANQTATAGANQTATSAVKTATAGAPATATAAVHLTATSVAQTATAGPGATSTSVAQTATAWANQTATSVAQIATTAARQTATAGVPLTATSVAHTATAGAPLTATARAIQSATVGANQTATTRANQTATAGAIFTATAGAPLTATARAIQTATAGAIQTAAAVPPTATRTATPKPPTATATSIPATATPAPPTSTPLPPTATLPARPGDLPSPYDNTVDGNGTVDPVDCVSPQVGKLLTVCEAYNFQLALPRLIGFEAIPMRECTTVDIQSIAR